MVALLEVRGQLGRDVARVGPRKALHRFAYAVVQFEPARRRQPLVERVPVKRVDEAVAPRGRTVRPFGNTPRRQEAAALGQGLADRLHLHHLRVEGPGHQGRGELQPGDARRLQQLALGLAEFLELTLDDVSHTVRHGDLGEGGVDGQRPSPVHALQRALTEQIVDKAHHEQRMAVGAPVDDLGQLRRDRPVGESAGQVLVHGGPGQELDPQLLALPVSGQLLLHCAQRMRADDHVDGAERAEQQQARRLPAARERGDEIERGVVAPVKVLEDEHEGDLGRQRLKRLGHLAEHALPRRPEDLPLQPITVGCADQRGHLDEPGGRVALENGDDAVPVVLAAESPEGLEHGHVGLSRAVEGETLAPRRPDAPALQPVQEQVDERGLPDTGLARDEDDLSLSAEGPVEAALEAIQLGVAPDRVEGSRPRPGAGAGRGGRSRRACPPALRAGAASPPLPRR